MASAAISTNKANDNLSLTNKPVLVQNHLGIFYGFLEKSDSRSGSALLRDGFKLSPDRHITFSQYLDFLSNEISDNYIDAEEQFSRAIFEAEEAGENTGDISFTYDILGEKSLTPNEILISSKTFSEHKKDISITEYASEGIHLIQHRTSSHANSRYVQTTAPLISLTNISAIVAISETPIKHDGLHSIAEDISEDGLLEYDDISPYYDIVSPLVTFGLQSDDLTVTNFVYNNYKAAAKANAINAADMDRLYSQLINDIKPTQSAEYIANSMIKQIQSYINEELIQNSKKLEKFVDEYIKTITQLPKLIVNSSQRIAMYKNLKKAQDNEQAK